MDLKKLKQKLKKEPEAIVLKAQVDTSSITAVAQEIVLWASLRGY